MPNYTKCRNINLLFHRLPPIKSGLALGPTNPGTIHVALETLSFRRVGLSPTFLLLVPAFSLPNAPPALAGPTSAEQERSSTAPRPEGRETHIFGAKLSPF